MGLFGVLIDYDEDAVKSLTFWQVDYQVACDLLPWCVGDFIGFEWAMWSCWQHFGLFTALAPIDIIIHPFSHLWPPIVSGY